MLCVQVLYLPTQLYHGSMVIFISPYVTETSTLLFAHAVPNLTEIKICLCLSVHTVKFTDPMLHRDKYSICPPAIYVAETVYSICPHCYINS